MSALVVYPLPVQAWHRAGAHREALWKHKKRGSGEDLGPGEL